MKTPRAPHILIAFTLASGCDPEPTESERYEDDNIWTEDGNLPLLPDEDLSLNNNAEMEMEHFEVSLSHPNTDDIALSWTDQGPGSSYDVWRSTTALFTPGDGTSVLLADDIVDNSLTDFGAYTTGTRYYYRIIATNESGETTNSFVGAKFTKLLQSGYNKVSCPIEAPVMTASTVPEGLDLGPDHAFEKVFKKTALNGAIWEVWNEFGSNVGTPGLAFVDFEFGFNDVLVIQISGPSAFAGYYKMLGYLPGVVMVSLLEGENHVTLPLTAVPVDASEIMAEIPGLQAIDHRQDGAAYSSLFDGTAQSEDFTIYPGDGVFLHMSEGSTGIWPPPSVCGGSCLPTPP